MMKFNIFLYVVSILILNINANADVLKNYTDAEVYLYNQKNIYDKINTKGFNPFGEGVYWESTPVQVLQSICADSNFSGIGFSENIGQKVYKREYICNSNDINVIEMSYDLKTLTTPLDDKINDTIRRNQYKDLIESLTLKDIQNNFYLIESTNPISISKYTQDIGGLPFVVKYNFTTIPDTTIGLINNKKHDYIFKMEDKIVHAFPVLTSVELIELKSNKDINRELVYKEIRNIIEKKYIKEDISTKLFGPYIWTLNDNRGRKIHATPNGGHQSNRGIVYSISLDAHPMVKPYNGKYTDWVKKSIQVAPKGF